MLVNLASVSNCDFFSLLFLSDAFFVVHVDVSRLCEIFIAFSTSKCQRRGELDVTVFIPLRKHPSYWELVPFQSLVGLETGCEN